MESIAVLALPTPFAPAGGVGEEGGVRGWEGSAGGAELGGVERRLRRGDRGVGIAHRRHGDRAALDHEIRLHSEEGRRPQDEIGELSFLDRADMLRDAMPDRRVERVFRDIAPGAEVVGLADVALGRAERGVTRALLDAERIVTADGAPRDPRRA